MLLFSCICWSKHEQELTLWNLVICKTTSSSRTYQIVFKRGQSPALSSRHPRHNYFTLQSTQADNDFTDLIVEYQVSYAAREGAGEWCRLPVVLHGVEPLHYPPSELQGVVHVQQLAEGRHRTVGLAARVIYLHLRVVLGLQDLRSLAQVYHQPHKLTQNLVELKYSWRKW